jgi:SAM-dependent methyltransferase
MSSVYDVIAEDYKKSRALPFRHHVEAYTYLAVIGTFAGKAVLDLACGEGTYARLAKRSGAARVLGVDLSAAMIELARQEEAREPLGIEYVVEDVARLGHVGDFDLVIASFLLNYARTSQQLQEMCAVIAANLRPGGRFVTLNNNSEQAIDTYEKLRKYGYVKSVQTPSLSEGSPITITIRVEGREFSFDNYYLSLECHERALRSAGFQTVRWHALRLAPEGAQEYGEEFWGDLLDCKPIIVIEATR